MKRVALTFIGKDRPGIVADVSGILSRFRCNIEDATMTLLEGEFAMILIASIPSLPVEKKLKQAFSALKRKLGLNSFWEALPRSLVRGEKHPPGSETHVVSVTGKDRTGIVYGTTRILARAGLNITDLNSKILGHGKRTVFVMVLEVDGPKGFDWKRLELNCKKLERRLGVHVHVKPLDRLSL